MTMPKEVTDAVLKVMQEVGYIKKASTNEFHNYKYASIEAVLEKVQPALVKCGLTITQSEVSHAIIADGALMEAVYEFTLSANGTQSAAIRQTGLASLRNTKGGYDDKALNKCHTAARKYFILGVFQIPTGLAEDPDAEEDKPKNKGAGNNQPQEDTGLAAAKAFVRRSVKDIGALTSATALAEWKAKMDGHLARLMERYPDEGAAVMSALMAQAQSFKAAAE
jgi:hypothetical protein